MSNKKAEFKKAVEGLEKFDGSAVVHVHAGDLRAAGKTIPQEVPEDRALPITVGELRDLSKKLGDSYPED